MYRDSVATAYCGNNIVAKIWRIMDDIYFNVFIKHRNPLTPIIISDILTKEEEEELAKRISILFD